MPATFWNLTTDLPRHAARAGRDAVPGDGRRHERPGRAHAGCATSRGTCCTSTPTSASASPCRTSCGPARSSSPRRPPPSTGGRCGVRPPARCSSGGSGCRCTARCATTCGSPRWCRRATTSSRSTSAGRDLHRLPVSAGQFLNWRFLTGPRLDPRPPLLAVRGAGRAQPAHHRQGARRRQRARPLAAPRHPGDRSKARTGGSPSGPAPARRWPSSAPVSGSPRCARWPRRCPTRRATRCCCSARPAGRCSRASSTCSPASGACRCAGCPAAGAPPTPGSGEGASADDLTMLRHWIPDIAEHDVYVCGPPEWTAAVRRDAARRRRARGSGARRELRVVTRDATHRALVPQHGRGRHAAVRLRHLDIGAGAGGERDGRGRRPSSAPDHLAPDRPARTGTVRRPSGSRIVRFGHRDDRGRLGRLDPLGRRPGDDHRDGREDHRRRRPGSTRRPTARTGRSTPTPCRS